MSVQKAIIIFKKQWISSYPQVVIRLMILFFLTCLPYISVSQISFSVADSETKASIPFANIIFRNGKSGAISDIEGIFSLPSHAGDSITISSFRYYPKKIHVRQIESSQTIFLEPKLNTCAGVNVFHGKNPALKIMEKAVTNNSKNNPNHSTNYSCIVYHKMTFDMEAPEGASPSDSLPQEINQFSRDKHLMLVESVSEKQHFIPDKNSERLISGRVSGLKNPLLAALPSQLQPFSFYSQHIGLMDDQYLNPASEPGLKNYLFTLRDTIIENNDTIYYITFQPLHKPNINLFEGSFHIHNKTYGIKNIRISSSPPASDYQLSINLSYNLINNHLWFPSDLESNMIIKSVEGLDSIPYPLEGKAKSLVTAVNLTPDKERKDFGESDHEQNIKNDTSGVGFLRYQPLTVRDSAKYRLLDSLANANNIDNIIKLQKELIKGYIPVGPLRLDLKHLVGYNKFEGLKLGIGLWTGDEITGNFTVGGYFKHAFNTNDNNYGTGIKWKPDTDSQTAISALYSHDMRVTGDFSFHKGNIVTVEDLLKSFAVYIMDQQTKAEASIQTLLLKDLTGKLFFTHADVKPVRTYPFIPEANEPDNGFTNTEFGIKLRWAHEEQLNKTDFGTFQKPSTSPKVWFNLISGIQDREPDFTRYVKIETQIEQSFRTGPSARTTLRLIGGLINRQVLPTNLYSFFGTYEPLSIEVPNMFSTMAPNEFAADRFALAFLKHKISLWQNSEGNFKPEINLMTKAGWGNIKYNNAEEINSFNQGFYESGILFDNLLNILFIKYGLGVHYRYGPLQKDKGIDNWSFRIGLDFSL